MSNEEFPEVEYQATLDKINLSPRQEHLMLQAIQHIHDAPTTLKKTVRWQFWFRQIWDAGHRDGVANISEDEYFESLAGRDVKY